MSGLWRRVADRLVPAAAVTEIGRVGWLLRWPAASRREDNAIAVCLAFDTPPSAAARWQHWPNLEDWMAEQMRRHARASEARLLAMFEGDR